MTDDIDYGALERAKQRKLQEMAEQYARTQRARDYYRLHEEPPRPSLEDDEDAWERWRCFKVGLTEDFRQWLHEMEAEAAKKRKQFAFTLTTNETDVTSEICSAAHKVFAQKTVPVRQGEAYLEYTKEGRPHIHGWYETENGGRIFSKVFHRCWPLWQEKRGQTKFGGGFHEEIKTSRYKDYASCEGRVICIKNINADLVYNAPSEAYAHET